MGQGSLGYFDENDFLPEDETDVEIPVDPVVADELYEEYLRSRQDS